MGYSVVDGEDVPYTWGTFTLTLSGAGTLDVDGETVEIRRGRYVLVPPDARRRPAAGPDGMSFLVIGGVPGGVYEPWALPEE